jgi:hypothetical protein
VKTLSDQDVALTTGFPNGSGWVAMEHAKLPPHQIGAIVIRCNKIIGEAERLRAQAAA